MSPFANYLKKLRGRRSLRQKEMAKRLGYEPSYISALERSEKGPPKEDFIQRLTRVLDLNEDEQAGLLAALDVSGRQISIPAYASECEYKLLHNLEPKLGHLHPVQIRLIEFVLKLPESLCSEEAGLWAVFADQSVRTEVPKM